MAYITSANATVGSGTSGSTAAFTTSGSNRLLLCGIGCAGEFGRTTTMVSSLVRNGQNLAQVTPNDGAYPLNQDHNTEMWALAAPNTASAALTATMVSSVLGLAISSIVFDNAAQSAWPYQRSGRAYYDADQQVTSTVTVTGSGAVFGFSWNSTTTSTTYTASPSFTSGTTVLATTDAGQSWCRAGSAYETGTGSQSFTWDSNFADALQGTGCVIAVAINATSSTVTADVSEAATAADTATAVQVTARSVSEAATAADTATAVQVTARSVSEAATAADASSAVKGAGVGPTSDVSVTGWAASAGGALYEAVDETVPSDTDFAYSSSPPESLVLGIPSQSAGNVPYSVRASAAMASTMIVRFVSGAGAVLGSGPPHAISDTAVTYAGSVAIASAATRVKIDVWPNDGVYAPDVFAPGVFQ